MPGNAFDRDACDRADDIAENVPGNGGTAKAVKAAREKTQRYRTVLRNRWRPPSSVATAFPLLTSIEDALGLFNCHLVDSSRSLGTSTPARGLPSDVGVEPISRLP